MISNHETFWEHRSFAVVGHAAKKNFPRLTYRGLKRLGKRVFPVDASVPDVDGDPTFADLAALPEKVEAVVLEVPKEEMTEWVASKWNVDRNHVLLTGLSDGATMTLLVGLGADTPFTHLAPVSGVLHPMNFAIGNVDRARGKPIYLVHGALDWMFPVAIAQEAVRVLGDAGAALIYRELPDLSHTYPREENGPILEWLDESLRPSPAR